MSFGAIADDYNRFRPSPPAEAVDWLLPAACQVAVDLAAGTGLLSRALAGQVATVMAVEPDSRMAAVLRRQSPGVEVVRGVGEAIPLRTGSADALLISSAWHWMNPELAVPEIARVLRPGGRFGLIWNSRDRELDWIRELDRLREPIPAPELHPSWRRREVTLPEGSPFTDAQTASFTFTRRLTIDDVVASLATYSGFIVASEQDRATTIARWRAALDARFPGATEIDLPMRSRCWRADRL
jgi:SAM-dependent methyltransferase